MNRGERSFQSMAGGANRAWRDGMQSLSELRSLAGESPETQPEIDAVIREMQRLDPNKFPGNPALLEQMRTQFLPGLEQLELKLRRELEGQQTGNVRSGTQERIPAGYSDQVADYFRRLSRGATRK
jgi:hypothetical protein